MPKYLAKAKSIIELNIDFKLKYFQENTDSVTPATAPTIPPQTPPPPAPSAVLFPVLANPSATAFPSPPLLANNLSAYGN